MPLGRERFGKVLGKNSYLKMGIKRQACGYGGRRDYLGEMGRAWPPECKPPEGRTVADKHLSNEEMRDETGRRGTKTGYSEATWSRMNGAGQQLVSMMAERRGFQRGPVGRR